MNKKVFLGTLILASATACGSGGGGDNSFGSWAGTWDAETYGWDKNTCNLPVTDLNGTARFLLNQNSSNIGVRNVASGYDLLGSTTSDNASLTAGQSVGSITCIDGTIGTTTIQVSFQRIDEDTAYYQLAATDNCNIGSCVLERNGTATRM